MSVGVQPVDFKALDACHQQILEHLAALTALARNVESAGVDEQARLQAAAIGDFFSVTSRDHHAEEEKSVFPPLLASGKADLVATVHSLQQDHGWIEENWAELAPQLSAIASGNNWMDAAEFQHAAQVFVALCTGHIALEESLIYPHAKAYWAQAVANRPSRTSRHRAA